MQLPSCQEIHPLTFGALQSQLQAQVPAGVQDPVVTGGCHIKHQPALLRGPDHPRVQQEQVRLPETKGYLSGERPWQSVHSEVIAMWSRATEWREGGSQRSVTGVRGV